MHQNLYSKALSCTLHCVDYLSTAGLHRGERGALLPSAGGYGVLQPPAVLQQSWGGGGGEGGKHPPAKN